MGLPEDRQIEMETAQALTELDDELSGIKRQTTIGAVVMNELKWLLVNGARESQPPR